MYVCVCVCICTYTYIYTCMYAYICTCIQKDREKLKESDGVNERVRECKKDSKRERAIFLLSLCSVQAHDRSTTERERAHARMREKGLSMCIEREREGETYAYARHSLYALIYAHHG